MLAFLEPPEMILIVIVVLVLFGGSQLPKLAKNLGKAQKEFKDALAEGQKEAEKDKSDKSGTSDRSAASDTSDS
jgi:sec-independent protein translocase protein TatA